jgi:hypothetical protein
MGFSRCCGFYSKGEAPRLKGGLPRKEYIYSPKAEKGKSTSVLLSLHLQAAPGLYR